MPPETDETSIERLWRRHLSAADPSARSSLIEHYRPFTRKIAGVLYSQRADNDVEFDEFLQFGMVGLIESVDRYRSERGASFETFARYRIRGAILNGLEKMSERREQYAYRTRLQRERLDSIARDDESGHEQGVFEEMMEVALGLAISYMLEGTGLIRTATSCSVHDAYQANELSQLRERLIQSLDALPNRERHLIRQHYFEHTSFKELSASLGISKGRVSQLHKRALQMLQKHLVKSQSLDGYY